MATKQKSVTLRNTVHLCIAGYSQIKTIPNDIVHIIAAYYALGLDVNTFLLLKDDTSGVKLYHVASQQISSLTIHSDVLSISANNHPKMQHIVHGAPLPQYLRNKYRSNFLRKHICSEEWSFGFSIETQCSLTAFHKQFTESAASKAYSFKLPDFVSLRTSNNPSIVYSQREETLYAMNFTDYSTKSESNRIVALPLHGRQETDGLKWIRMESELLHCRHSTSICMVDRDRFVAILGGKHHGLSKQAELFAINCNMSIPLKEMHRERANAISAYHEGYHKIVIAGSMCLSDGIEVYDINKDQWTLKPIRRSGRVQDMFLSKVDPNAVHITIRGNSKSLLAQVDLRTNKQTFHELDDVAMRQSYCREMPFLRL